MAVAFFASFLPARATEWARGVVQPISFLQKLVSGGLHTVSETRQNLSAPEISQNEVRRLKQENEELLRQIGADQAHIAELQNHLNEISGLRDQFQNRNAQIIFARVIAQDADRWRDTIVISAGTIAGVKADDWVTSGRPAAEIPAELDGRSAVARQWIIGKVLEAEPYTSRVRLTTDPSFQAAVRPARVRPDRTWQPFEQRCILKGRGRDRKMLLDRAPADFFAAGATLVLLEPDQKLPLTLALGHITGSRSIVNAPLFFDVDVEPFASMSNVSYVYVVSPY